MTEQQFRVVYPLLAGWIQKTLAEHSTVARPVASLGFRRLPLYYDEELLAVAKTVPVAKVPVPPLSAMGLTGLDAFERMEMGGITFMDTYFVRADLAGVEWLHFHELVHVVQWRCLGPERFLACYAEGLERFGYLRSPLELIAFRLQRRFERETEPFSVEAACQEQLRDLPKNGRPRRQTLGRA
jgi:hypothetical protein